MPLMEWDGGNRFDNTTSDVQVSRTDWNDHMF